MYRLKAVGEDNDSPSAEGNRRGLEKKDHSPRFAPALTVAPKQA